jgi:hypothetical protein
MAGSPGGRSEACVRFQEKEKDFSLFQSTQAPLGPTQPPILQDLVSFLGNKAIKEQCSLLSYARVKVKNVCVFILPGHFMVWHLNTNRKNLCCYEWNSARCRAAVLRPMQATFCGKPITMHESFVPWALRKGCICLPPDLPWLYPPAHSLPWPLSDCDLRRKWQYEKLYDLYTVSVIRLTYWGGWDGPRIGHAW